MTAETVVLAVEEYLHGVIKTEVTVRLGNIQANEFLSAAEM